MKITVATRLEGEVKKKIEKEAKKRDRSVSWIINERLKQSYNRK